MLSSLDSPTSDGLGKQGNRGLTFPKSPPQGSISNDGSMSPPGLIFSWSRMTANEPEEEHDSPVASPRLWRPGSSACAPISSYPMSGRAQEIAKGRQELMNMYEEVPESAYELSLKDLVEQKEAMEKRHHRTNTYEPHTKRGPEKDCSKRTVQRHKNKKRNGPKGFLLNMFLPGNLTIGPTTGFRSYSPNSPRISRQNSDQSSKHEHHTHSVQSPLKMKTSQSSAVSSSNSNSKISPKPCSPMTDSGKFGQRDQPSNCDSSEPKPKSSKRCSMCSEHIIFFKTNCQACGKVFCSSCAKVAIESTPKGRKCQDTCDDQSYRDRDLAPQVNSCWPFPWRHKVKSERKARNPSSEKVKQ